MERDLLNLRQQLDALDRHLIEAEAACYAEIEGVHPDQRDSARNLVHYLALRSEDIRSLQDGLHIHGLSALASAESHVRMQLRSVLHRLGVPSSPEDAALVSYDAAQALINAHSEQLFGAGGIEGHHVMVTMTPELATDERMLGELLLAGMTVARINCAHDDMDAWSPMITSIRNTSKETGSSCRIYMDLAGPKMRTVLLGLGRDNDKVPLFVGQEIVFAEQDADYDPGSVVFGCQEAGVVDQLDIGHRVLFDDGVEEAVVVHKSGGMATLRMVRTSSRKPRLRPEKGINLPDTELSLPPLTEFDRSILPYVCEHADLIGYSFVRSATDVRDLQQAMRAYPRRPALILKIETSEAVRDLPELLLQAMHEGVVGAMIARGDLAVEIGFERMSEIQEEILWICEAAHVPVIWATQVLESMNKSGIATRSEVTDASHAVMAECVLLNKGEHILQVMSTLREILERSGTHRAKKRYTLRPMKIATRYLDKVKGDVAA
jgi:pyruvate kinase